MQSFIIEGGHRLKGEIVPQGAKNEALEVICATLLTDESVRIKNVPDILDVNNLIKLLKDMGVKVKKCAKRLYFQSQQLESRLSAERRVRETLFFPAWQCADDWSAAGAFPQGNGGKTRW